MTSLRGQLLCREGLRDANDEKGYVTLVMITAANETRLLVNVFTFQTQPRCLFPRLVDQFALPISNSKKPVAPLVMQCIKAHLHQVTRDVFQ